MLRYDLDKLGWYEFENLCQTLLKHKLGLGIEAWGGTKDWGRDAYYLEALKYPTTETQEGPFLFQCKFVNGANSAGTKTEMPIMNAINKECDAIKRRVSDNKWEDLPSVYTFLTNAILTGKIRSQITKNMKMILPNSIIVLIDGKDICGLIDLTTGIARRFPQILSLNDLDILLSDCVNRDILNRSEAAIEEAKEINKIFVPTDAYAKALNILQKFHYVVLEGPPEVGKTAIGRMIALAYIPEGWEVIECRLPNDFLRKYSNVKKQIFIADDSFGRTEYNPERVSLWQDDLPSILTKINNHHFLIMTSRKHLLEIAKEKLDIPGANRDFPLLAEVLVDVSSLTNIEKTLMLYKHMKNASLTKDKKMVVRGLANVIIQHKGFTPERVRELAYKASEKGISFTCIEETFQNPTGRMSKTYRELQVAHKWFMISVLLNSTSIYLSNTSENTKSLYETLCPPEEMITFEKITIQLSETFIKVIPCANPINWLHVELINWIHPSCGDMVATELSDNPKDRIHFLTHCNIAGLKYAVSVGGGSKGSKILPLLKSSKDWKIFKARCSTEWDTALLNQISDSIQQLEKSAKHQKVKELLKDVLREIVTNAIEKINNEDGAAMEVTVILKIVKLYSDIEWPTVEYKNSWFKCIDSLLEILDEDLSEWPDISMFIALTKSIVGYDQKCFEDNEIQSKWRNFIEILIKRGEEESSTYVVSADPNLAEKLYDNYDRNKRNFNEISNMMEKGTYKKQCMHISENFGALMEDISQHIPQEREYEQDDDLSYRRYDDYSVENIFRDL